MIKENNLNFSQKKETNPSNKSNENKSKIKADNNNDKNPIKDIISNKKIDNKTPENKNKANLTASNILYNILKNKNLLNHVNNLNNNNSSCNSIKYNNDNSKLSDKDTKNNNNVSNNSCLDNNKKNDNSDSKNNNSNNNNNPNKNLNKNEKKDKKENKLHNDDFAIYLVDSEDDKEIEKGENKNNNEINQKQDNNINNNNQNSENNKNNKNNNNLNDLNDNKMNISDEHEKINPNISNNNINNLNCNENNIQNKNLQESVNNKSNINEEKNENENKNEDSTINNESKKLYYRRRINSNNKKRFKGKDKLNVQVFLGNYGEDQLFPTYIFNSKQFFYTPRNYRHIALNKKGYIISFPNLINLYHEKIIEKDLENLFTYYFKRKRGKQSSLDIKVKDEKTLNDGVFLNDGIVNFYLKIIEDYYTSGEGQSNNVLIQKSFFYNSLSNQQNSSLSNEFIYPESCSFTKTKINVFSFKTLIIPICEHYHWSLIIVNDIDKMKNIFKDINLTEYNLNMNNNIHLNDEEYEYPEIFYLDSIYNISPRRVIIILKYLFYEYQKIYSIKCNMYYFFQHNHHKIEYYNPDIPKQDNSYDCGIFLLMYVELFLYNPNYFLKRVSKKYKINIEDEPIKILNNNINDNNIKDNNINNNIINDNNINNNINNNNYNIHNNMPSFPNNYIINNNIINNINITNNINKNIINNLIYKNIYNINFDVSNRITNENFNSDNIIRNRTEINSLNTTENFNVNNIILKDKNDKTNMNISMNNTNNDNDKNENENISIESEIKNINDISLDKIDIEIEDTPNKINNNENCNLSEINNDIQNENQNEELNNKENKIENNENSLRNWFSLELVNNQRNKVKNLINELSKIEKGKENKNDIEGIMKEQNSVIKKYMEMQKKEFDDYFSKLKD